jgi:hypothetical protein
MALVTSNSSIPCALSHSHRGGKIMKDRTKTPENRRKREKVKFEGPSWRHENKRDRQANPMYFERGTSGSMDTERNS